MSGLELTPRHVRLREDMRAIPAHPRTGEPNGDEVTLTRGCMLIWNEGWPEPPDGQTVVTDGAIRYSDGRLWSLHDGVFIVDAADLTSRRLADGDLP